MSISRRRLSELIRWTSTWLAPLTLVLWLAWVCWAGTVHRVIEPEASYGFGADQYFVLPGSTLTWIGSPSLKLMYVPESPERPRTELSISHIEHNSDSALVVHFAADPNEQNHRSGDMVLQYPRKERTATPLLFLLACVLASRWAHTSHSISPLGVTVPAVAGCLFALFAVQAWLGPPNSLWFLAIGACGLPAFLARLGAGQLQATPWMPWLLAIAVWAALGPLIGEPYASTETLAGLLALTGWGLVLYLGLGQWKRFDGEIDGPAEQEPADWAVIVFLATAGLSLARDAGFDLAGGLASLGLGTPWTGGLVNPWTTKFLAHWLLVTGWCVVGAAAWRRRSPWQNVGLVLLGVVTLFLNGSKSGLSALIASAAVALLAWRWPGPSRRWVVLGLVALVLLAPLVGFAGWHVYTSLEGSAADPALAALELHVRGAIWEFSRRWIGQQPVQGWGLGATSRLPGGDLGIEEALAVAPDAVLRPRPDHPVLAGGHPHNAALQVWLDLGLIGVLLLGGLILAAGRSLGAVEDRPRTHAALLALLTVHGVYLAFNYPLWAPEVQSLLWMSVALASATLPAPTVHRRKLLRGTLVVLVILVIGGGILAQDRLARWWTVRQLRQHPVELDPANGRLTAGGETRPLNAGGPLIAHAEWLESGWIRGWAFDPTTETVPEAVLVFVGDNLVGVARPELESTELFRQLRNRTVAALTAGFLVPAAKEAVELEAPVRVVALTGDGARMAHLPPLTPQPAEE